MRALTPGSPQRGRGHGGLHAAAPVRGGRHGRHHPARHDDGRLAGRPHQVPAARQGAGAASAAVGCGVRPSLLPAPSLRRLRAFGPRMGTWWACTSRRATSPPPLPRRSRKSSLLATCPGSDALAAGASDAALGGYSDCCRVRGTVVGSEHQGGCDLIQRACHPHVGTACPPREQLAGIALFQQGWCTQFWRWGAAEVALGVTAFRHVCRPGSNPLAVWVHM